MNTNYDARVDAYIAKSAPFAQPILEHLRRLVHEAAPMVTETIKWGFPFFDYKGQVCHMSAFKEHAAFGFWKARQLNDPHKLLQQEEASAGSLGKITSLLPPGSINSATRLALINAIYFKGKWTHPFPPANTVKLPFFPADHENESGRVSGSVPEKVPELIP